MIFDKIAYKFEHSNKKDNKLRSAIRLGVINLITGTLELSF